VNGSASFSPGKSSETRKSKNGDSFNGWLDAKIDREGLKEEVDELVDEI
jgi:hypothetical protein